MGCFVTEKISNRKKLLLLVFDACLLMSLLYDLDSYITSGSSGHLRIGGFLIMMGLNTINSFMKITIEIQSWLNIYT